MRALRRGRARGTRAHPACGGTPGASRPAAGPSAGRAEGCRPGPRGPGGSAGSRSRGRPTGPRAAAVRPSSTASRTAASRARVRRVRGADGTGLDDATGTVDVADGRAVRSRHEQAAVRLAHEHPLGDELAHRLAHRVAGDAQRRADPLLRQPGARPQPALDDLLAHLVGHPLRPGGLLAPGPGEEVDGAGRVDGGAGFRRVEHGHATTVRGTRPGRGNPGFTFVVLLDCRAILILDEP